MPLARKAQKIWNSEDIYRACKVYAVTDSRWLDGRSLVSCVAESLVGGATFVQLRKKDADTLELVKLARALAPVCRVANVPLVINDDIEAAKAAGVDGVHLGQGDMSAQEARKVLGPDAIIGISAQTVDQAREAQEAGASYLGVGAMFATATKLDTVTVSIDTLKDICDLVRIPVVAIGGIDVETVPKLKGTHIAGVAAVSAIFAAQDIEQATVQLRAEVEGIIQ